MLVTSPGPEEFAELELHEREYIEKAKGGSSEDFGKLVLLYQGRLRAFAARYVGNGEDVFDLVQEAFMDAFQHLDRFDGTRELGPWLRAILHHRILNHFRSRKVRRTLSLSLVDEAIEEQLAGEDSASEDDSAERVKALRACIAKLGADERELMEMRYQHMVSVKKLAEMKENSAAGMSMKLMRVREALRRCVEKAMKPARA